jgi:hypothetical protein
MPKPATPATGHKDAMNLTAASALCKTLACALGVWLTFLTDQAHAAKEIPALDHGDASILASVLSLHQRQYSGSGPSIRIFEIGGGDPAMNGALIYICLSHGEKTYLWKTGLNVREIKKITLSPGNRIMLRVHEDQMGADGVISHRITTYQFQFRIDDGVLQNTLFLEST